MRSSRPKPTAAGASRRTTSGPRQKRRGQPSRRAAPNIAVARRITALRKTTRAWRQDGESIALVPTMGALHEGHLRLVKLAARKGQRVIVSIFVNPTQFAPHEDLDRYPRDEAADLAQLAQLGVDLVWAPAPDEVYPTGFATEIVPAGAALGLESDARPHFFRGVATICCKLFTQVQPDVAVFGEKDYQQLQVIKQLVRDLDLPLKIIGAPTVREKDGLALSSRNKYLSRDERLVAPLLHSQIKLVASKIADGARVSSATAAAKKTLTRAGFKVDYLELRDAVTLAPVGRSRQAESGRPAKLRLLAAAWLGKTRLIDNCAVK